MANGSYYSPMEFRLAVKAETTLGTANVATMQLINHEGIFSPNYGAIEDNSVRSVAGRTEKVVDHNIVTANQEKEFSFSAIADKTMLKVLVSNAMTVAVSTSPASFDIPFGYVPQDLLHGATSGTAIDTLTFAWVSAEASKSKIYIGCTVTSLTIKGDALTDGGRVHVDVTVKTGYAVSDNQSTPSSMTAYPTTWYYIYDPNAKRQIAGADVILNAFDLTIANNSFYRGAQGSGFDPEVISRAQPGIEATGNFNVAYDDNTSQIFTDYAAGTTTVIEFSDNATFTSASTGVLGWLGSYAKLTLPILDEAEAGMGINIPVRFTAHTSGDVLQLVV